MKTTPSLVLAAVLAWSAPAVAQVSVTLSLPTIQFAAPPPLVVVSPGVQVVEDYDDEVYYVDNWYWVRRGPHWYRTHDHHGGWVVVEQRQVPMTIVRVPVGRYRKYKAVKHDGHGDGKMKMKGKGGGHKHGGKGRH